MIVFGSILIGIVFAVILFLYFKQSVTWWEYLIILSVPIGLSFASKAIIEVSSVTYTEYWGSHVVYLYEEEPYNEWHEEMCSYDCNCTTDDDGFESCETCWEDCSHQDDYGPSWWVVDNYGNRYSISEERYDKWLKLFGTGRTIINTIRNHDPSDRCVSSRGTKFEGKRVGEFSYKYMTQWDGEYEKSVPITTEHYYENRIKASDYSLFEYTEPSEEEIEYYKLYDYPDLRDKFNYPVVLGTNVENVQNVYRRINGYYGPKNQIRLWVLVFDGPEKCGYMQENYWVGGNKNELVITIGVDSITTDIKWCHVFSWCDSESIKSNIEYFVTHLNGDKKNVHHLTVLDTGAYLKIEKYVREQIEEKFERLEFSQFSYLTVEPPTWAVILTYVITILICFVISVWIVVNEFKTNINKR